MRALRQACVVALRISTFYAERFNSSVTNIEDATLGLFDGIDLVPVARSRGREQVSWSRRWSASADCPPIRRHP